MHVIVHVVGIERAPKRRGEVLAAHLQVHTDSCGCLPQSIQVIVQEHENTLVQAYGFPDAVTDQVSTVEYRDAGLISGHEISVDVYQDLVVTVISDCVVSPMNHLLCRNSVACLTQGCEHTRLVA